MSEFSARPTRSTRYRSPRRPECAEVIAEVWTLLDGECTPETRQKLTPASRGVPALLAASMGSRSGSRR